MWTVKTRHIVPTRTVCACDRSLALYSPPSPSQSSTGTPAPPSPESKAFWGIRNRCASCPSSLNSHTEKKKKKQHTHILACTHTLAAFQNQHQDSAGMTGQRDPELDPGSQHLRQERDAIGFSCDPPSPLYCLPPPLIKTNCFLRQSSFHYR